MHWACISWIGSFVLEFAISLATCHFCHLYLTFQKKKTCFLIFNQCKWEKVYIDLILNVVECRKWLRGLFSLFSLYKRVRKGYYRVYGDWITTDLFTDIPSKWLKARCVFLTWESRFPDSEPSNFLLKAIKCKKDVINLFLNRA